MVLGAIFADIGTTLGDVIGSAARSSNSQADLHRWERCVVGGAPGVSFHVFVVVFFFFFFFFFFGCDRVRRIVVCLSRLLPPSPFPLPPSPKY